MKSFSTLLIIIYMLLLSSCATPPSGDLFSALKPVNTEKALVYLYRPDVYYGKAITYPILLDNKKIADLGNLGFFAIELDPGTYNFLPDTSSIDNEFFITLESGTRTFLRLKTHLRPAISFATYLKFETVDEAIALNELKEMREEIERVYIQK